MFLNYIFSYYKEYFSLKIKFIFIISFFLSSILFLNDIILISTITGNGNFISNKFNINIEFSLILMLITKLILGIISKKIQYDILINNLATKIEEKLLNNFFKDIINNNKINFGKFTTNILNDVNEIIINIFATIIGIINEFLIIIIFLSAIIYYGGISIFFIILPATLLGILLNYYFKNKIKDNGHFQRLSKSLINDSIYSLFNNVKPILATKTDIFYSNFFSKLFKKKNLEISTAYNYINTSTVLNELIAFSCGIYVLMYFDSNFSITAIIGVLFLRITFSLARIFSAISAIKYSEENFLDITKKININDLTISDISINNIFSIKIQNYPCKSSKFLNINLTNGIYWIRGDSGSGKTYLIDAILCFNEHKKYIVFNENIKGEYLNINSFSSGVFSYYAQNSTILYDTFLRNFKDISADLNNIINIFQILNLKNRFIESNYIGDYGNLLSMGQKQRLLLAIELLRNSKVLILDEPTSSLDPTNTDKIYEYLSGIREKIVIIVSHDDLSKYKFNEIII